MDALVGALRVDLRRAFRAPLFLVAVLLVIIVNYLSILQEYWATMGDSGLIYYIEMWALTGALSLVLFCLGVVPYGFSFCHDWKNQFIRPAAIRTTKTAYAWSKVIAVATSGFACIFLGFVVTTVTMLFYTPLASPDCSSPPAVGSLMVIHPLLFLLARVCMIAWACMFWAVFALLVSSYCANIFVVLAAPVITYTVVGAVDRWLPDYLRFGNIDSGNFAVGGPLLSVLYVMLFYSVLSAVCGLLFCRKVTRRLANG
jgi:hypothetical protein